MTGRTPHVRKYYRLHGVISLIRQS